MIRNVVIHIANEQPLLADLFDTPTAGDYALVCTNLRSLNGKRPIFVDHVDSLFVFPLLHIRFVEIPPGARGELIVTPDGADASSAGIGGPAGHGEPEPELDLALDEDFLRRVREL